MISQVSFCVFDWIFCLSADQPIPKSLKTKSTYWTGEYVAIEIYYALTRLKANPFPLRNRERSTFCCAIPLHKLKLSQNWIRNTALISKKKFEKTSRCRSRSPDNAKFGHFKWLVCKGRQPEKCTTNYNVRAQPLFCSLNLLFIDVLVAVVLVFFLDSLTLEHPIQGG